MAGFDAPWRRLIVLAVVALCMCGCRGGAAALPVEESPVSIQPVGAGFDAAFAEPAVKLPASYVDPRMDLPIDLALITNFDVGYFSDGQRAVLRESGFFVEPDSRYMEFDTFYMESWGGPLATFITTDSLLHAYHLVFSKLLREMEEQQFHPQLSNLTVALTEAAGELAAELDGTSLEKQARHVWAYFAVAEQLLLVDPPAISEPIYEMVQSELAAIEAQSGFQRSPVLSMEEDYQEDYSQYVPRGHYTRSELRQRYFKTMIWYGRMNLRLKSMSETQAALLITYLVHGTDVGVSSAADTWASIYDPTAFLVGSADDLGIHDYTAVAGEVFGGQMGLDQIADAQQVAGFIAAARQLPAPQINSMLVFDHQDAAYETQGFRFMGQRFVLDSFMLSKLVHKHVSQRWLPSGLDVFACFGNAEAFEILEQRGDTAHANYTSQLDMLQEYAGSYAVEDWTSTVYNGWLYSLEGMTLPKDDRYPPYMRTRSWARRELSGALGSWAELRHDTILYAKPGYGSPVSAPPPPPPAYVEPNPRLFARLTGLVEMTAEGLQALQLSDDSVIALSHNLLAMLAHCQLGAEAELAGEQIPEDTALALFDYAEWLGNLVRWTRDQPGGDGDYIEEPSALIADVATDPEHGEVLEVGTGRIDHLLVAIPAAGDELHLALGGVFSYYEFAWPINDRLTDEAWREQLTNDEQPDRPAWTGMYTVE